MFAQSNLKNMANSMARFPETEDEIIINCPRCDSNHVLVSLNQRGYYEVKECHDCGYRKIFE